ncbi:MAG: abortive infection family protein [Opitutales bacterium]|nr:abortive infection family protein [Opitutales bacterium]
MIEITPSMGDLCKYIEDIETFAETKPNIALDSAKSLLESISKTILADRKIIPTKDDFHKVVRDAIASAETIKSIQDGNSVLKLLSGFTAISNAIGELRNKYGFYCHGRDVQADKINPLLADFIINCSLSIATFLLNLHDNERLIKPRLIYDDNALFNNYFDNVNEEITIRGIAISQSKALFYEDEEAYREELMSFHNEKNSCIIALKTGFTEEKVNDICEYKSVLLAEDLDIISNYFKDKEDSFNALPQYIKDNFKEIFQEENIPLGYDVRIKF